jgi:formylglycine-generating enzyme required for sulfatase activity
MTIAGGVAIWTSRPQGGKPDGEPDDALAAMSSTVKREGPTQAPDSNHPAQTDGPAVVLPEQPGQAQTSTPKSPQPEPAPAIGTASIPPAPEKITRSIGLKLTLIPAGDFLMGSSESLEATVEFAQRTGWKDAQAETFEDEHPQHTVSITKPFYLGTYEVTKGQFAQFVDATDYKTEAEQDGTGGWGYSEDGTGDDKGQPFKQDPRFTWRDCGFRQSDQDPVVNVSWNDAVEFCVWLSRYEGKNYRLPTEAEWEYACRAGTTRRFNHSDEPEELVRAGNVWDSTASAKWPWRTATHGEDGYVFTAPVGQFQANEFGLYDMHGNVWEWCADWYGKDSYANSPRNDPAGPTIGSDRVRRGGSWYDDAWNHRAAYRGRYPPWIRSHYLGFRVAMQPLNAGNAAAP